VSVTPKKSAKAGGSRRDILQAVNTPLCFYVLALLIIESFFGLVIATGKLNEKTTLYCINWGLGLFVAVIVIVSIFAWFKPDTLIYDKNTLFDERKEKRSNQQPSENIISDIISSKITNVFEGK
jgi:heme A synthase